MALKVNVLLLDKMHELEKTHLNRKPSHLQSKAILPFLKGNRNDIQKNSVKKTPRELDLDMTVLQRVKGT